MHPDDAGPEERELRVNFGRALQAARRRAGLSQAAVAKSLGFTASYISHVEAGRRNLTLASMAAIARAIGCNLGFVFEEIRRPR